MKNTTQLKRVGAFITGLLAIAGLSQTANAQLISITAGKYTINANGYSSSTLTANLADSAPGGLLASGGGTEDTWGIFQITSILDGATVDFTDNGGKELWGIFYNSVDNATSAFGPNVNFEATGLKLDIYEINVADTMDSAWQSVFTQGLAGRAGIDGYTGISDVGNLVFQSELNGTMYSSYNLAIETTSATGNLTIGATNTLFDIDSADMTFALTGTTEQVPSNWIVEFGGPIVGVVGAVPEPSTYGLMAAGALAAVVVLRRRKQKSVQA